MKPMTDTEKWKVLAESDLTQAASLMGEEAPAKANEIAEKLGLSYMIEVVSQLDSSAAADLLKNLPADFREQIIASLPDQKTRNMREILSHAAGTAGAIMSKEYLAIREDATIQETIGYLQSLLPENRGKISYIYVMDKNSRLVGVIQVRDLIFHQPDRPVKEVMISPVVQVEVGMSQMDVAKLLKRHRYLGLPVVDAAQKLVGVISADNVLQAMEEETSDDIAKIIGTSGEEVRTRSILVIMKLRLPWLLVSIASGLLCAFILGVFQNSLQTIVVLFLFVPVVLGVSESTGVQGATIVVRNITLGHVSFKDLGSLFLRELLAGILIGFVCGSIVGSVASIWQANHFLGLALASSLALAIIFSSLIGLVLPLLFRKLKIDPAMASGPLVLAICDLQTLIVYFSVSSAILSR